jgi:hypothetical protein
VTTSALQDYDVLRASRILDPAVIAILKAYPDEVFICGGFLRSVIAREPINDIDLIVKDANTAALVAGILHGDSRKRLIKTDNAYTITRFTPVVQVIHRWTYSSPVAALAEFDFTIAQAALWWGADGVWKSACSDRYYADLAAKRLVYVAPARTEDAGGSLLRLLKFYQRGYRAPLTSVGAVVARLVRDVRDEVWLLERDPAWEARTARVLTGLLNEVDPNIDPDHICHEPATPEEGA